MDTFSLLNRVRDLSPQLANALLNQLVPQLIPLAGGLSVRVRELTPTRIAMTMPLKRRTRNHLGTMYFGAQMTLADLAVGVVLFQRYPPGPYGGVIRRVEAEFLQKAKSGLTCTCALSDEVLATFAAVESNQDGKAEAWVPLELMDSAGTLVTRVRFLVAIKKFKR